MTGSLTWNHSLQILEPMSQLKTYNASHTALRAVVSGGLLLQGYRGDPEEDHRHISMQRKKKISAQGSPISSPSSLTHCKRQHRGTHCLEKKGQSHPEGQG